MRKRGAKGAGTIRKRSDGRWEARAHLGFDPATGKQLQKSIYGKTQREVRELLSQTVTEIDDGTYMEPCKITVGAWLDEWMSTYITYSVKSHTVNSYEGICNNHIKPGLGRIRLCELRAVHVQRFYNGLLQEKKLSAKTVRNVHGVLHKALEQAVKLEMIATNCSNLCDLPKARRKDIHPLEQEDIARFLKAIEGNLYELLYIVTLFAGLRQGEVLGLTWDCVDFEANTLYINKQLQKEKRAGGPYNLVPTKNDRCRIVMIAPSVMAILRKQYRRQLEMRLRAGATWNNEWNLVFTNEEGRYIPHYMVYRYFKRVVNSLGLPEEWFHDLRHSYAVAALESGDDIKTVQSNLGHATASFTLDVYGHISQKMRQQSAARMECFFQSVSC